MENSPKVVPFKPGDELTVEVLYAEARPKFIPWIMDRYNLSQPYAEEVLVESTLTLRNLIDEGKVGHLYGETHFLLYSIGAKVADTIVGNIAKKGLGPIAYSPDKQIAADAEHGVEVVEIPFTYKPVEKFETPLQKLAEKARGKLNPECQDLLVHMSRTNLTVEQLAKVAGYSTAKGLQFMKDICMDKFSALLDEEIKNR